MFTHFMPHTQEEIIEAIEYSMFGMYPHAEGVLEVFNPPGAFALISPMIDYWELNRVGHTSFTEENVDSGIKSVLSKYHEKNLKSIAWIVGPKTSPQNFTEHLENNDFKYQENIWGMYKSTSEELDVDDPAGLTIRDVPLEEFKDQKYLRMYEKAYGMPEGAMDVFMPIMKIMENVTKMFSFVAFDGDDPVGVGAIIFVPNTKIALLGGAATLPEYRKRGIYTSMLKYRLDIAKKHGMEYLIIQAKEETSAPVAAKNGFIKLCDMPVYVWQPDE